MSYRVLIVHKAEREFHSFSEPLRSSLHEKILSLEQNPRPFGSKKLRESDYYRVRSGDYRIIYMIDDAKRIVTILGIAHRRDAYR
jgi:mRNA interferase RelE/StbE